MDLPLARLEGLTETDGTSLGSADDGLTDTDQTSLGAADGIDDALLGVDEGMTLGAVEGITYRVTDGISLGTQSYYDKQ